MHSSLLTICPKLICPTLNFFFLKNILNFSHKLNSLYKRIILMWIIVCLSFKPHSISSVGFGKKLTFYLRGINITLSCCCSKSIMIEKLWQGGIHDMKNDVKERRHMQLIIESKNLSKNLFYMSCLTTYVLQGNIAAIKNFAIEVSVRTYYTCNYCTFYGMVLQSPRDHQLRSLNW